MRIPILMAALSLLCSGSFASFSDEIVIEGRVSEIKDCSVKLCSQDKRCFFLGVDYLFLSNLDSLARVKIDRHLRAVASSLQLSDILKQQKKWEKCL